MARKQHTYHYIYKTTCYVTGRYYIGMHSTSNLEDGYIGSGKRLWLSINKHGVDNHTKEILEFLENRQELKNREHQLVNADRLKDITCMNLQIGGGGGFFDIEHQTKCSSAGGKRNWELNRAIMLNVLSKVGTATVEKMHITNMQKYGSVNGWLGKTHKGETLEKMKVSKNKGENNPQYGMMWITNGIENKKIKNSDIIPNSWSKGRIMRSDGNS